ncbi:MAG: hypothetical protein AAGC64_13430 [Bacteroidota bacterium]
MMGNKNLGIGVFLVNLAPTWFSALAPFFLLFALFALITSIIARFSEKTNKSEIIKVLFFVLAIIGGISSIWILYELTMT